MHSSQLANRRQILSDEVYGKLLEKIRLGYWKQGEKIPSESEMCNEFGVSRVTVRKALHKLQGSGLLHTHQGQGTFVSYAFDQHIANAVLPVLEMSEKDFFDFFQLRRAIEFKAIELAAIYAEEDDIRELEHCLNEMISYTDVNERQDIEADFNFHLCLIKSSKNKLFYSIMLNLRDVYILYLEQTRKYYRGTNNHNKIKNHRGILEALKMRDSQAAIEIISSSMEYHVRNLKPVLRKNDKEIDP